MFEILILETILKLKLSTGHFWWEISQSVWPSERVWALRNEGKIVQRGNGSTWSPPLEWWVIRASVHILTWTMKRDTPLAGIRDLKRHRKSKSVNCKNEPEHTCEHLNSYFAWANHVTSWKGLLCGWRLPSDNTCGYYRKRMQMIIKINYRLTLSFVN